MGDSANFLSQMFEQEPELTQEELEEFRVSKIKLTDDLRQAARNLETKSVRYYVSYFYDKQEDRKRAKNQLQIEKPNELLVYTHKYNRKLEMIIKEAMREYASSRIEGRWLMDQRGIAEVLSAGLLAYIDITRVGSVAGIWRYAGMDPTVIWEKKENMKDRMDKVLDDHDTLLEGLEACASVFGRKSETLHRLATTTNKGEVKKLTRDTILRALMMLPWNAEFKTLCWKMADCQVKFQNYKDSFYGPLFRQRKAEEYRRSEAGEYATQIEELLTKKKWDKNKDAYKAYSQGKLPKGHIHAKATRWLSQMMLSHLYDVMYEVRYGRKPAKPYAFSILGHDENKYIPPPGWDIKKYR